MDVVSTVAIIVIFVGLVCLFLWRVHKREEAVEQKKQKYTALKNKTASSAILDVATDAAKNEFDICIYCGNAVKKGASTCSLCGAPIVETVRSSLSEFTEEEAWLYMYHIGLIVLDKTTINENMINPNEAVEKVLQQLSMPVREYDTTQQASRTSLGKVNFFQPTDKALLLYIRFRFIQFAKTLVIEKARENHRFIICDACGGLVDIDHNHTCPHCGQPYGNDAELQDIMDVVITNSEIYMDINNQKILTRRLYETFRNWNDCFLENILQGNVKDLYPPGYEEISKYIKEQK